MGNRWIAHKEEVTYGTNPGTWTIVGGVEQIPVVDFTPSPNNNTIGLKESVNLMEAGGILGGFVGENRISMYGRPDNLHRFLKWSMGTDTPSVDGDTQKHTYAIADGVKSFTLEYNHGYGSLNPIVTVGNVVKTIEMNAAQNRPLMVDVTTQYKNEDIGTAALALDTGALPALRPYTLYDGTITSFTEEVKCENVRCTFERTIPDDVQTTGSRFLPDISEEGYAITGELDARFTTYNQRKAFYGGAGASTSPQNDFLTGAVVLAFTGPATGGSPANYDMTITIPAAAITTMDSGTVGRERLRQTLRFQAYSHTSAGVLGQPTVVLRNDIAT